ncbi:MAG: FtsX-like permease family protein [Lentisphaerae bacterium]|nr:FtsX-like permease family protein [Lentisphaerota bacterium]
MPEGDMTAIRYLLGSLRFHRRTLLGVVLGTAVAATVLIGALMVGDSVRYSLTRLTLSRLGGSDFVLVAPERFFRADLAGRLRAGSADRIAAALLLNGVALTPEGDRRVNDVQVVGVDDAFWGLAPRPAAPPRLEDGACLINGTLADRLGMKGPGDAVVLRLRKPGGLPADLTLAAREADTWSRRLGVAGVQTPDAFGHFTLKTTQNPPPTVFVPLSWLGAQLDLADRANVLLIQAGPAGAAAATPDAWQARLDACWRLDDAGLRLELLPDGGVELLSDQVFIAQAVAEAAFRTAAEIRPVITYFVNRIESNGRSTPYSFASAAGPPRVPEALADDEVLINDWLAEDLGVSPGSPLTLAYYAVDAGGRLEERTSAFTVAGIVPTADVAAADRRLAPVIPGLSDTANCRDWDPGIPIDLRGIRDQDEAYWQAYGPLPKLYLARTAAERLWSNRFGVYTALRFPRAAGDAAAVADTLRRAMRARDLGFVIQPAKAAGLAASREAVDFGQLFTGLSFFLIAAAVLLAALLFAFNVQQRADETATLRALGFLSRTLRNLRIAEGLTLAVAGTVVGGCLAAGYDAVILRALQTVWRDAVRTSAFQMHVRPGSVAIGAAVVVLAAVASMAWVIRGQMRTTPSELRRRGTGAGTRLPTRRSLLAGAGCLLAAGVVAGRVPAGEGQAAAGAFFASGSLVLAGLLAISHGALGLLQQAAARRAPSGLRLAISGVSLRPGRSLACIALVALGVFLVSAVAANRRGTVRDPGDRTSGTGGYALWGQTTLPLTHDLNSARGRARFGLSTESAASAGFTQLRLREGDDASCLNLNRVAMPHLLGVDPAALDQRGACSFVQVADGADASHPWRLLDRDLGPDTVPAIADWAVIRWGLGKAVGDTLTYTDDAGHSFQIRLMAGLAPSIFQGHLIVAERHLLQRFPSLGGARVLLVDAPPGRVAQLERELTGRLADLGIACVPTARRLAEFNSVENTYLSIFMLLGGLGVLLGSAGLGVVAARNILERRAELAALRAIGFRRNHLQRLLFTEHGALALAGIVAGALAAGVAVTPALLSPEVRVPWSGLALTLGAIVAGSLLWIGLAVNLAMRGPVIAALRNE